MQTGGIFPTQAFWSPTPHARDVFQIYTPIITYIFFYRNVNVAFCQILNWQAGYQQAHHSSLVDALGLRHFEFNSLNMQIETVIHLPGDKRATLSQ